MRRQVVALWEGELRKQGEYLGVGGYAHTHASRCAGGEQGTKVGERGHGQKHSKGRQQPCEKSLRCNRAATEVVMSRTASSAEFVSILVPVGLQEPLRDFLNTYQDAPRNISDPQQLNDVEQQLATASDQFFSAAMQTIVH